METDMQLTLTTYLGCCRVPQSPPADGCNTLQAHELQKEHSENSQCA